MKDRELKKLINQFLNGETDVLYWPVFVFFFAIICSLFGGLIIFMNIK